MLHRRLVLASLAVGSLWLSACSQVIPSELHIRHAELEQGLQKHFPKRYPVAGLLQLEMQQPVLQLQPATNQLATTVHVMLSGPALKTALQGEMQLRFGLRYEPKDHSVRATRSEVQALQFQGMSPAMADMLSAYGPRLAQQALEVLPLYTVEPDKLSLMQSLGLQPGAITVTEQGLTVAIVAQSAAPAP